VTTSHILGLAGLPRASRRLYTAAAGFLFIYSLALTLAPAARLQTWFAAYRWQHWLGFAAWLVAFAVIERAASRLAPRRDSLLLPLVALLAGWGLLSIFRLSSAFGLRQSLWLLVSAAAFVLGLRQSRLLPALRRYKYFWLTCGLGLTALTFLFGTNPLGAGPRLWLGCCGLYFQPSEPLKLLLIVYLAAYLADRKPLIPATLPLLVPTLLVASLALLLLIVQRDLGAASIFLVIYTAVVFAATGRRRILIASAAALALAGLLGNFLYDVVALRVEAWLDPWADPSGRSFQIIQSLIGIAAGGLLGRGPGMGSPGLVPVAHSDFIYAALAEEHGLLGSIALLTLLALFVLRGLRISLKAADRYRRHLALGITAYIVSQSILIIGGNIRLLPLTGVTLPFVSYGGSSLLTSFLGVLLLTLIADSAAPGQVDPAEARPALTIGALLLAGLAAAGLTVGWWAFWRGPDLLTRIDNVRRSIAERYTPRGGLLDRNYQPLNYTRGAPGSYERVYAYAEFGAVLGFNNPVYGQAGAEAGFDSFLRGLANYPAWDIWRSHLLWGQPPPGLDVRLSLDAGLQQAAQQAIGATPGAVVILNPVSGELLALASSPSFDPAELNAEAQGLFQDSGGPLLNRATQALYRPGPLLGPLLYAYLWEQNALPPAPGDLEVVIDGFAYGCARTPPQPTDWAGILQGGCPGPLAALGVAAGGNALLGLYAASGFYDVPLAELPAAVQTRPDLIDTPGTAASGHAGLRLTPVQAARALAALSNHGLLVPLRLGLAVENPHGGWTELAPAASPVPLLSSRAVEAAARLLANSLNTAWEAAASAQNAPGAPLAWYVISTLPGEPHPRLVLVLLEADRGASARAIGADLFRLAGEVFAP
jgi:cell division protein FtsW (lipid II flippase)